MSVSMVKNFRIIVFFVTKFKQVAKIMFSIFIYSEVFQMQIYNVNTNTAFTSRIKASNAFKEVKAYAESSGRQEELKAALDKLDLIKEYRFDITHMYSKVQDTCKTVIKYKNNGQLAKHTLFNDKVKNPVGGTFNWILALANRNSALHKEIFR